MGRGAADVTTLVTGGGGFLGGAIVRGLLARGNGPVRTFSRGNYPWLDRCGVDTRRGDIADRSAVEDAVANCKLVVHVAAKAGVWGKASEYENANLLGTQNVVEACRRHGVSRLVFTSSPSVVFHGTDESGVDETLPYPTHYLTDYPRTKAAAERHVLAAASEGLKTVALRPHLIWGPGDPHLVPRILERAGRGRLALIGDGQNRIDSTYIDNAAHAHLLAADRLLSKPEISGKVYFISNGEPMPIRDLLNGILAAGGQPPVKRQVPVSLAYLLGAGMEILGKISGRRDEPLMTRFVARQLSTEHWYDLTRARDDLGYKPLVSVAEGLESLRAFLEKHSR